MTTKYSGSDRSRDREGAADVGYVTVIANRRTKLPDVAEREQGPAGSWCIGRIVGITDDGRPVVDFPGNRISGLIARTVVSCASRPQLPAGGIPVLLSFENDDPCAPVVVGVVSNAFCPAAAHPMDEELVLEAERQIVLRCGKSTITLRRDGRITVRGAEVTTRASGRNKIRGASVEIN